MGNKLYGNSGDDLIVGRGGDDYINGGSGSDAASYQFATGAVEVDLAARNGVGIRDAACWYGEHAET